MRDDPRGQALNCVLWGIRIRRNRHPLDIRICKRPRLEMHIRYPRTEFRNRAVFVNWALGALEDFRQR